MVRLLFVDEAQIIQSGRDPTLIPELPPYGKALLVMLCSLCVPAKLARENAATIERPGTFRGQLLDYRTCSHSQQRAQTFFPISTHQPEARQRQCEMELRDRQPAIVGIPGNRRPEILEFLFQTFQPLALRR